MDINFGGGLSRSKQHSDYDVVICELYRQLREQHPNSDAIPFTKSMLEAVAAALLSEGKCSLIKNLPDLKYSYDSRKNFPDALLQDGYWGIVGKGKALYELVKLPQNNLISLETGLGDVLVQVQTQKDLTDPMISKVLGNDEQATMRRIETNGIIEDFLGIKAQRLQGHERTVLSCGQVEIDEVYVGTDGVNNFVIPISGKGHKDFLSYTQALNLSLYTMEKPLFKDYHGRPLGVWQKPGGAIYVVEFSCSSDVADIRILRAKAYHLTN